MGSSLYAINRLTAKAPPYSMMSACGKKVVTVTPATMLPEPVPNVTYQIIASDMMDDPSRDIP